MAIGVWSGYRPDVWFAFDDEGFDRDPAGRRTGWRAYAYKPLPGAFWPTNGSADDVAIRLPAPFRERSDGTRDDGIYVVNLAILQSLITQADVAIAPTDERPFGVDLDRDGTLGTATRVVFAFDPRSGVDMSWVGRAKEERTAGRAPSRGAAVSRGHGVRPLGPLSRPHGRRHGRARPLG